MSENPGVNPLIKCPEVKHFDEKAKKFILMDCIGAYCGKWSPEFQCCGYRASPAAVLVLAESLAEVISQIGFMTEDNTQTEPEVKPEQTSENQDNPSNNGETVDGPKQ